MKKVFSKSLSLILALALMCTVMMPCITSFVALAEGENADIEALKAAWGAMTTTEVIPTGKNPTVYTGDVHDYTTPEQFVAKGGSLGNVDIAQLGSVVATYDVKASETGIVYFTANDQTAPYSDKPTYIHEYQEAYFYYKVNSVKQEGKLNTSSTLYTYIQSKDKLDNTAPNGKAITITADSVNAGWQRISYDDIYDPNWKTLFPQYPSSFVRQMQIKAANGLDANISFGSFVGVKPVAVPEGNDWGINEWLSEAVAFDTENLANVEQFETTVAELLGKYPDAAIAAIKNTWVKLTTQSVDTNKRPTYYRDSVGGQNNNTTTASAITNGDITIDGLTSDKLGSIVGKFDVDASKSGRVYFTAHDGVSAEFASEGYKDFMSTVWQYSDMYICYKVNSVESEGSLQTHAYAKTIFTGKTEPSLYNQDAAKIYITEADEAKGWQKIPLQAFFEGKINGNWQDVFVSNAHGLYNMYLDAKDGLKANITFGTLVGVMPTSLPENSESWTLEQWCDAILSLSDEDYTNTQIMDEIFSLILKGNSAIANKIGIERIKAAWGEMAEVTATNKMPTVYTGDVHDYTTPEQFVAEGGSLGNVDIAQLGSVVATYDVKASETGIVYFTANDQTAPYSDKATYIHEYQEAYFYYKVNSVKQEGTLNTQTTLYTYNSSTGAMANTAPNGKAITITADSVNAGWQRISYDDIYSPNWKTLFPQYPSSFVRQMQIKAANGLDANISFGSFVGAKDVALPTGYEDFTLEDWCDEAAALKDSDYVGYNKLMSIVNEYSIPELDDDMQALYDAWTSMSDTDADFEGDYEAGATPYTINSSTPVSIATDKDLADIQDAYIYYKVDNVANEGALYLATESSKIGLYANSDKIYVSADDIGEWHKLSIADFVGDNILSTLSGEYDMQDWRETFTGKNALKGLKLYAVDGLNATITVSNLIFADAAKPDFNPYGWGMLDWLIAADNLDISNYGNTDKFTARLNELKIKYMETLGADLLENAWGKMTSGGNAVALPTGASEWSVMDWLNNTDTAAVETYDNNAQFLSTFNLYKNTNANDYYIGKIETAWGGLREYVRNLYTPYSADTVTLEKIDTAKDDFAVMGAVTGNFTKAAGTAAKISYAGANNGTTISTAITSQRATAFNPDTESDIVFRINIDKTKPFTPGTYNVLIYISYFSGGNLNKTFNLTQEDYNRGYIEVSADEVFTTGTGDRGPWNPSNTDFSSNNNVDGDWHTGLSTSTTQTRGYIRKFEVTFDAACAATLSLGSAVTVKNNVALPENTEGWTLQKWALEAQKVLETEIQNPDELQAVLDEIKGNSIDIEKALALRESLRAAYKPVNHRVIDKGGLTDADIAVVSTANSEEVKYFGGYSYKRANLTGGKYIGFKDVSPGDAFDQDVYFNYRIQKTGEEFTPGHLKFILRTSYPFSSTDALFTMPVTEDIIGQWQTVRLSDIVTTEGFYYTWYHQMDAANTKTPGSYAFVGDHWSNYTKTGYVSNVFIMSVDATFTIECNALFKDQKLDVEIGDGSTDTILEAAKVLNTTGFTGTEDFGEALAELESAKASGDATGDGKVNAFDLLRAKRYAAAPKSVQIFMYACDTNDDGSITADDLTGIVRKILGL